MKSQFPPAALDLLNPGGPDGRVERLGQRSPLVNLPVSTASAKNVLVPSGIACVKLQQCLLDLAGNRNEAQIQAL